MRMLPAAVAALVAVTGLAGCTTAAEPHPSPSPTPIPTPTVPRPDSVLGDAYVDPSELTLPAETASLIPAGAEAVGCTDLVLAETPASHTTSSGKCTYDDARVRVYEFATADDYATFISDLEGAGIPTQGMVRRGPLVFAVNGLDARASLAAALEAASFPKGSTSLIE